MLSIRALVWYKVVAIYSQVGILSGCTCGGGCTCVGYELSADWCVDLVMERNNPVVALSLLMWAVGVGSLCLVVGVVGTWCGISGVCPP
jgi:hypothetical protein